LVLRGVQPYPLSIVELANAQFLEYSVALESDFHHSFWAPSHAMNQVVHWQVPEFGLLKCNVDANWHKDSRNGGFGYVVRDSSGNFVAAKAICF